MENTLKKSLIIALLVLAAVISALPLANWATKPDTHTEIISSIDEKTVTVLRLTASTTLASAVVSAMPGDLATPIAEKLADLTEYFLLTLCVLYSEKYLLSILGTAFFRFLIPLAAGLMIYGLFRKPDLMHRAAFKLLLVGLALYLVIPASIRVSDAIYRTYEDSINTTIASAEEFSDKNSELADAEERPGGLAGALEKLSETAETLAAKASNILNRFIEALAVMIVTSCIIPILVLIFFLWIIRQITGLDLSPRILRRKGFHMPASAPGASETTGE